MTLPALEPAKNRETYRERPETEVEEVGMRCAVLARRVLACRNFGYVAAAVAVPCHAVLGLD
jgi:hypothetical protein